MLPPPPPAVFAIFLKCIHLILTPHYYPKYEIWLIDNKLWYYPFDASHFWCSCPWGWTKGRTEREARASCWWPSTKNASAPSPNPPDPPYKCSSLFSFSCCPSSACKPATEVAAIWKIHSFKIQKPLILDIPWTGDWLEWKAPFKLPGEGPRLNRRGFGVIIN